MILPSNLALLPSSSLYETYVLVDLICCKYAISKRVFAKIGDDIQLNCPHYSPEKPTQWLGPEDLLVYALGQKVNDLLKNAHKLAIIGESFNLQISNISIYETGQYRCIVLMKGLPISADFIIEFYGEYIYIALMDFHHFNVSLMFQFVNVFKNIDLKYE